MRIEATYQELSAFASMKAGKNVEISYISPDTIKISLNLKVVLFTSRIGIKVKVEKINPRGALLRTEGNYAVRKVVHGALSAIRALQPDIDKALELKPDNRILILFGKIEKMEPVLANVNINSLTFSERGAVLEVALK